MTVASGQFPYQYEWPVPFRATNNMSTGISGIHFEAAQFVMQAEMRKFNVSQTFQQLWRVYTNTNITASGYDPRADGATLDGVVGPPAVIELDTISRMRNVMLNGVLINAYDFVDYDYTIIFDDWIKNCYPESPSGYAITSDFLGQFLRPIQQADGAEYIPGLFGTTNPVTGVFTETDPHWLGGSGIILDIDVGEVMWNPFPLAAAIQAVDVHGTSDNFTIRAFPFFPMFQKTDGSLISLNGLENKWPEDPIISSLGRQYNHVSSGKVRFNAYGIFTNTDFLFGAMNTVAGEVHQIPYSSNQMSVAAESARPIGNATKPIAGSEVFLTPITLSSGVYRVAMRNPKVDFPYTTIESGVSSQWPQNRDLVSTNSSNYYGYEVFNTCFWITDDGVKGSALTPTGPSGLAVVSPYTGRILWQRNASNDIAGIWYNGIDYFNVYWWDDNTTVAAKHIQRVGTDRIQRLIGRNAPIDPGVDFDITVAEYTDDLATVSNNNVTLSLRPNNTFDLFTSVVTMWFDGSSYWVTGSALNDLTSITNEYTWELDSSFTEIRRISGNVANGRYIGTANGKKYGFGGTSDSLGIIEWDVITAINPEGYQLDFIGSLKQIDITTHLGGTFQNGQILNFLEISGVSELNDGVYVYARIQTTTTGNKTYILRIEESTTTWTILGLWSVLSFTAGVTLTKGLSGFIVMPVN